MSQKMYALVRYFSKNILLTNDLAVLSSCACREGLGVKNITHKYLQGVAGGQVHYTQVPAESG